MLFAGRKSQRPGQRRIGERLLDETLAVVECAVDGQRAHVAPPAGELLCLPRRHETAGIQHHDVDPRPTVERGRHSAAGVPEVATRIVRRRSSAAVMRARAPRRGIARRSP